MSRFAAFLALAFFSSACGEVLHSDFDDSDASTTDAAAALPPDGGMTGYDASERDAIASYRYQRSSRAAFFVDDFERADGPVGNGWRDGTEGTFALSGGAAVCTTGVGARPADASLIRDVAPSDVEACAVVQLAAEDEVAIFLRGAGSNSYRAFLSSSQLSLARVIQSGGSQMLMEGGNVFLNPLPASRYVLCFRVSGVDSVFIEGAVYDVAKMDAPLFSARMTDSDNARLKTPGYAGLAAKLPGVSRIESFELR